jgi:hypothetical protein
MLNLPQGDGSAEQFDLAADPRVVRGAAKSSDLVASSIELTKPFVTPLTKNLLADDKELAAFWAAEKSRYRYDYVTFRCNFEASERHPFEKAWVEVVLAPDEPDVGPIAWSMAPDEIADVTEFTEKGALSADLKLVKSQRAVEVKEEVKSYFLRARREHTAKPYWEFCATDQSDLTGTFRLHLVTRTPVGLAASGRISVRAVIEKRTFFIFKRNQASNQPAAVGFALPVT